jgi:hypothetical protein
MLESFSMSLLPEATFRVPHLYLLAELACLKFIRMSNEQVQLQYCEFEGMSYFCQCIFLKQVGCSAR